MKSLSGWPNLRGWQLDNYLPSQFFLVFVFVCDYLIKTNSYFHAGACVSNRSYRHDADRQKIGWHKRMLPTCRDDIFNMSATDKIVCRLRGGADRHKSRHCQPSWGHCTTIDTALYLNEKGHWQWWYFIVDTILSLSHPHHLPAGGHLRHILREQKYFPPRKNPPGST